MTYSIRVLTEERRELEKMIRLNLLSNDSLLKQVAEKQTKWLADVKSTIDFLKQNNK